mmetsp:Transcript_63153/g.140729  ORF Transcript_63153/g.140729 Transcript_63153/m.140729 type:complete len:244 (+) Transcript_63153:96-827(+)
MARIAIDGAHTKACHLPSLLHALIARRSAFTSAWRGSTASRTPHEHATRAQTSNRRSQERRHLTPRSIVTRRPFHLLWRDPNRAHLPRSGIGGDARLACPHGDVLFPTGRWCDDRHRDPAAHPEGLGEGVVDEEGQLEGRIGRKQAQRIGRAAAADRDLGKPICLGRLVVDEKLNPRRRTLCIHHDMHAEAHRTVGPHKRHLHLTLVAGLRWQVQWSGGVRGEEQTLQRADDAAPQRLLLLDW